MKVKFKYRFNPDTLTFEKPKKNFQYWIRQAEFYVLISLCIIVVLFLIYFQVLPSPYEKMLRMENTNLKSQLELLEHQADQMQLVLADLQQRDENLYRVIFQAEPISTHIRTNATRKMAYYEEIASLTNSQLMAQMTRKMDILEKQLYVQSKSYDEVVKMVKEQNIRNEHIPAIQPVMNKDLTRVASGYGIRIDPIYHVRKFHYGMDFTAPVGTDVYATGKGKIVFVGWKQGYGNTVILDHGYNYKTLYAHLYKATCYVGQQVKRGDVIALVGNTGKSTGPHLHYEVRFNDNPIDPRNYYFNDLSPEDYDKLIQLSNNFNGMLD